MQSLAEKYRPGLWVAPAVLLLATVLFLPIGVLLSESVGGPKGFGTYTDLISRTGFQRIFLRTLSMAATVTIVTIAMGYPYAFAMARARKPVVMLLTIVVFLPLWTGLMPRSFAWVVLLGDNGIINRSLALVGLGPIPLIRTPVGVTIGMAQMLLPFMVLPLVNTIRGIDQRLLVAAGTLGASRFTMFRTVLLPLSVPGIMSGATAVFVMALGFYVTPALLGSPQQSMLAQFIDVQANRVLATDVAGAASVLLLLVVAVLFLAVSRLYSATSMIPSVGTIKQVQGQKLSWPLRIFCAFVACILLMPLPVVVLLAFTDRPSFEFPPPGYSLMYFKKLFTDATWTLSIGNSIKYSFIAAVFATIFGTTAALGLLRGVGRWSNLLYYVILSPMMIPGVVGAIAVYVVFLRIHLSGTAAGIIIVHTALGIPFVLISVLTVLRSLDTRLGDAAATMGASRSTAFRTVSLPLIIPGILGGAVFAFLAAFDEVVYALFLQSVDTRTLPVKMFMSVTAEIDPTIAAASTVIMAFTSLLFLLTIILQWKRKR